MPVAVHRCFPVAVSASEQHRADEQPSSRHLPERGLLDDDFTSLVVAEEWSSYRFERIFRKTLLAVARRNAASPARDSIASTLAADHIGWRRHLCRGMPGLGNRHCDVASIERANDSCARRSRCRVDHFLPPGEVDVFDESFESGSPIESNSMLAKMLDEAQSADGRRSLRIDSASSEYRQSFRSRWHPCGSNSHFESPATTLPPDVANGNLNGLTTTFNNHPLSFAFRQIDRFP